MEITEAPLLKERPATTLEIANSLGLSRPTARKRLRRAALLGKLVEGRSVLRPDGGGGKPTAYWALPGRTGPLPSGVTVTWGGEEELLEAWVALPTGPDEEDVAYVRRSAVVVVTAVGDVFVSGRADTITAFGLSGEDLIEMLT